MSEVRVKQSPEMYPYWHQPLSDFHRPSPVHHFFESIPEFVLVPPYADHDYERVSEVQVKASEASEKGDLYLLEYTLFLIVLVRS